MIQQQQNKDLIEKQIKEIKKTKDEPRDINYMPRST